MTWRWFHDAVSIQKMSCPWDRLSKLKGYVSLTVWCGIVCMSESHPVLSFTPKKTEPLRLSLSVSISLHPHPSLIHPCSCAGKMTGRRESEREMTAPQQAWSEGGERIEGRGNRNDALRCSTWVETFICGNTNQSRKHYTSFRIQALTHVSLLTLANNHTCAALAS